MTNIELNDENMALFEADSVQVETLVTVDPVKYGRTRRALPKEVWGPR